MNMIVKHAPPPSVAEADYRPRLFSKAEYWQLSELGFFTNQKVELIAGEIIQMAAQSNRHGAGITLTARALDKVFTAGYWVRAQMTLDLTPSSMPDPDIAVVVGDPARPSEDVPTTALLIVEVCDTSIRGDRSWKASLYASVGITDYWIVNLQKDCLEIRRDPRSDTTQDFGHGYASLTTLHPGDFVSPLAMPTARIAVADLFPG